jgi:hypothetical protein
VVYRVPLACKNCVIRWLRSRIRSTREKNSKCLDFNFYLVNSSRQLVAKSSDLCAHGLRSVPRERGVSASGSHISALDVKCVFVEGDNENLGTE